MEYKITILRLKEKELICRFIMKTNELGIKIDLILMLQIK
jgi:hypothetical protein